MASRVVIACAGLLLAAPALAMADTATFNIPAQPLGAALRVFAEQAKMQLLYESGTVSDAIGRSVTGELEKREALELLLRGTGLEVIYSSEDAATIRPSRSPASGGLTTSSIAKPFGAEMYATLQARQAQSDPVTAPAQTENAPPNARATPQDSRPAVLEDVTVTAQKREERLQDVPVPVTVVTGQALAEANLVRVQDYYAKVPGLNFTSGIYGQPRVSIRGLATNTFETPTVGIMIDGVPYGPSSNLAGDGGMPEIDPADIARVEVLRGPQGTLYGANAFGGLIHYVTVPPATGSFGGRLELGVSDVHNGDDVGFTVRGNANIPVTDELAFRVSAFDRDDPGYVDNVHTGRAGVNEYSADGGRFAALWQPSQNVSIQLSAMFQELDGAGSSDVDLGLGDLEQSRLPKTGQYGRTTEFYTAIISGRIGDYELASVSGYNVDDFSGVVDFSAAFGTPTAYPVSQRTEKFSQEFRFSTSFGDRVDWRLGAYYADEDMDNVQDLFFVDPTSGDVTSTLLHGEFPNSYREYALFTDFTFHASDRLEFQVGGRQSWIDQTYSQLIDFGGGAEFDPEVTTSPEAFTFLFTSQYRLSSESMIYARVASGYRPGGPNSNTTILGVPAEYNPDETINYELGMKGDLVSNLLSLDASVYWIDWSDIQLLSSIDGFSFHENGDTARSRGVELSVDLAPAPGWTLSAWLAINEAELTEDLPPTANIIGLDGDRLPFASRLSGNLSVDYDFAVSADFEGSVGLTMLYVGDRLDAFTPSGERQAFPSYSQWNLRGGLRSDKWSYNAFVNNATDERGALSSGQDGVSRTYIQPRTIGVLVSRAF